MNQFKYEPSGRDVKVTLSGAVFIDSNPRIQALITLFNSMDPEFLSRTTHGRIVVELQDALHDALDKYGVRELAKNYAMKLMQENPKIKTDERERNMVLRSIKGGVLAPYSGEIEKQINVVLERSGVSEAKLSPVHSMNADAMQFQFILRGGVEFFLTNSNSVLLDFNAEEQAKLCMLIASDKSYAEDVLDAIPEIFNSTIQAIPSFMDVDAEIKRMVKELIARQDPDEIKNWKTRVPYSSLTYYSSKVDAEIQRQGWDVSERSKYKELQRSKFYEKYGHKVSNQRINEVKGTGKHGRYDVSVAYGYAPGDFRAGLSGLVTYKLQVDAKEEANLILVNDDTFGEEFNARLRDFTESYFKGRLSGLDLGNLIQQYVDHLLEDAVGSVNLGRHFEIFIKDLMSNTRDPLYKYRAEIKTEIESRGIILDR